MTRTVGARGCVGGTESLAAPSNASPTCRSSRRPKFELARKANAGGELNAPYEWVWWRSDHEQQDQRRASFACGRRNTGRPAAGRCDVPATHGSSRPLPEAARKIHRKSAPMSRGSASTLPSEAAIRRLRARMFSAPTRDETRRIAYRFNWLSRRRPAGRCHAPASHRSSRALPRSRCRRAGCNWPRGRA